MIEIRHAITPDDPLGEPWPPATDDNWHVVRRAAGFTLWRAIELVPPAPPSAVAHPTRDGSNRHSK
jgi:hypothetical protein